MIDEIKTNNKETSIELMTVEEASKFMNIKESMIRSLVFRRKIPRLKIGGLVRFNKPELIEWLKEKGLTV